MRPVSGREFYGGAAHDIDALGRQPLGMLDLVRCVGGDGFAHHVEHAGRAHTGRYMGAERHLAEGLFGSAVLEEHRGIVRQHHDGHIEAGKRGGDFRQAAWRCFRLDLHPRCRLCLDDRRLVEKRREDHHKQEDKHNPLVHAGGKRGERAEDCRKQHRPFAPYARQQAFSPRSFVWQVPSRRRFVFLILELCLIAAIHDRSFRAAAQMRKTAAETRG